MATHNNNINHKFNIIIKIKAAIKKFLKKLNKTKLKSLKLQRKMIFIF